MVKNSLIQWKEGQNIIQMIKERNKKNQKQGKRRKSESRTFFTWYEDDCDPTADETAEVIKDDLWPNPPQHYLSPGSSSTPLASTSMSGDK
jgi:template-activating factor I